MKLHQVIIGSIPEVYAIKTIQKLQVALSLVCIVILWGCQGRADGPSLKKPNILLIVSEDNGPDLGCYGVKDVHTPNIDGLATQGVRYERAFVTYSVCSPSRSTLFTGLYPHQNGQIGLATHKFTMYESYKTLPVFLKEAGYRTGCLGKIHINPESAVPWDFHPIKNSNFAKKDLPAYAKHAAAFMHSGEEPFFLMVNYPDAHCDWQAQVEGMPANPQTGNDLTSSMPFVGIDNPRHRTLTANYYNSMDRLDEAVGMLLDSLATSGKAQNTLIVYLGDHGAQFSRGKCSNYESGLRIPLIIQWPGRISEGEVSTELISTVDLVPTLLSVTGLAVPDYLPGTSLLAHDGSRNIVNRTYLYADGAGSAAFYFYPRRSVRDDRYKLIRNLHHERENPKYLNYAYSMYGTGTLPEEIEKASPEIKKAYATWRNPPEFEFYDLETDPFEFNDLSTANINRPEFNRLKQALLKWQEETVDPLHQPDLLDRITFEMDSVNNLYPNRDYAKQDGFAWEYPNYFKKYIDDQIKRGEK